MILSRALFRFYRALVICCLFICSPTLTGAQEKPESLIDILCRLSLDQEFYQAAQLIGVSSWDKRLLPFPLEDMWLYSVQYHLSNIAAVSQVFINTSTHDPFAFADEKGIPVFVDIEISGDIGIPDIEVSYTIREVFAQSHRVRKSYRTDFPSEYDLLSFFWAQLVIDLENFILDRLSPPLTIRGPAQSLIYGFTENPLVMPDEGVLSIPVYLPRTFQWKMVKPGFYTRTGTFFADKEHTVLNLPQDMYRLFSFDLSLFMGRFPELWFSWYEPSCHWIVSIGMQQQVFGLFLSEPGMDSSFAAHPLIMPGVSALYRFYQSEKPYAPTFFLSAALFMRINYADFHFEDLTINGTDFGGLHTDDLIWNIIPAGLRFDDFSPMNLGLSAGYNWETRFNFSFFFEVGAAFYLLGSDYRNADTKGSSDPGILQYFLGDILYLEAPTFRFGLRYRF
ncbi:MAG: hypothetical protein LBO67_02565 [Spirochaetaceae bacterium]|jgi:hypothetical protein|nr:hypothetical protein [Spirochaetaceae bacterium]